MQTYSHYSRILLIEYLQKTIFFKKGLSLNNNYYAYFILNNKNRLFIIYNANNSKLKAFIKYDNIKYKDFLISTKIIKNNIKLESFVNQVDIFLNSKNLKKGNFIINDFNNLDFSLNI